MFDKAHRRTSAAFFLGLVILLAGIPSTLALPDSNTDVTGVDCSNKHTVSYSYSFKYPSSMEIGKASTLQIVFKIKSGQVTQNPIKVTAKITADGFAVSATSLDLTKEDTIEITPLKTGATINIVTTLTLDGDTSQHSNYKGKYVDTFTLKGFDITTPSVVDTQPNTNSTLPDSNSTLPDANSTLPDTNSTLPGTNSTLPGTNSTEPGTTDPDTGVGDPTDQTNSTGTGSIDGTNSTTDDTVTPPDVTSEGDVSIYSIKVGGDTLITVTIEFGDLSLVA